MGPQHQYIATEGCDTVRTTLLTWSQKPTVQATDTVQKVSHGQEPVRPTPLRLAYERPREFGSRAALRGRATLAVVRLLSLHQPSLAYSPNIRVGQRSCHPIAPCIAEWRSTSRKRSTAESSVHSLALPHRFACNVFICDRGYIHHHLSPPSPTCLSVEFQPQMQLEPRDRQSQRWTWVATARVKGHAVCCEKVGNNLIASHNTHRML